MDLIKNALREIHTTDAAQATRLGKILQAVKLSIHHIQQTVHQTVQVTEKNGQQPKDALTSAMKQLDQVLAKATLQAPASRLTSHDHVTLLDESSKKAILAAHPNATQNKDIV